MTTSNRVVVLIAGDRKHRYPLPPNVELQDSYLIDGIRWTVVAVLTTDEILSPASVPV